MKLAEKMRKITNGAAYNEDSTAIKSAYNIIADRIVGRANAGKSELIYPFDGISRNGLINDGTLSFLDDKQIKTLVKMFEREGFTYHYAASQDPGHPCDRELHVLRW